MRFRAIEEHRSCWPISVMCRVFRVSVAGFYAWRKRPDSRRVIENTALLDDIRAVHAPSQGRCGSPRVHAALRARGRSVGRGRVERLMRVHDVRGLIARPRRACTTNSRHAFPVAPNLLNRQFTARRPNQVWLADLTLDPRCGSSATGEGEAAKGSACAARGMAAEGGSTWRPSWTCTPARSSAGLCAIICVPSWPRRHS